MSDGNFNRSLLPHSGYAAGVRAGRAQMKPLAVRAFLRWYDEAKSSSSDVERATDVQAFRALLDELSI